MSGFELYARVSDFLSSVEIVVWKIAPRSTCITRTGSVLIVQRKLTSITGNTCPLIFLELIRATDGLICGVRTRDW